MCDFETYDYKHEDKFKNHQKRPKHSIRSQRRQRCGIRKTLLIQGLADFISDGICFFASKNRLIIKWLLDIFL